MADIIKFEEAEDNSCIICGDKFPAHLNKMVIMRTINNENLISCTVCDECLARMASDIISGIT